MADVIRKATNKFTKGLVMDFSPENTRNEVLTHALNATLLTFNGNELSLQNDMGNGRVETAYLPEGYMPVGTCEYGGIIYIVSYNPLEDKSQIGCFPSPERNVSSEELGITDGITISMSDFQEIKDNKPTGNIKNTSKYVLLKNDDLNPGDKFLIHSNVDIYNESLLDLQRSVDGGDFEDVPNPIIALNVVSIEESGRIVYLNSDLRQYEVSTPPVTNKYHILGEGTDTSVTGKIDIDSYRTVLSSGYNVFKSKTSGKLAILAELVTIDSYSVTHSVVPKKITIEGITQNHDGYFDVIIHTDVTPQVTASNYNTVPKLSYYHLEESQGYLQTYAKEDVKLFDSAGYISNVIEGVKLSDIFVSTEDSSVLENNQSTLVLDQFILDTGKFMFPKKDTYHGRMEEHDGFITSYEDKEIYTKFTQDKYHRVATSQVMASNGVDFKSYFKRDLQAKFYKYNPSSDGYTLETEEVLDPNKTYYVETTVFDYKDAGRNTEYKDSVMLYKNVAECKIANSTIINDTSIEKYQETKVYTATLATADDIANYTKLDLYIKTNDGYKQITGMPVSGETYYLVDITTVMTSIGTSPDTSIYRGDIFYYPGNKIYVEATKEDLENYWDFDKFPVGTQAPVILYYREKTNTYRLATESEMANRVKDAIALYYKSDYELIIGDKAAGLISSGKPVFVVVPVDSYVPKSEFEPSTTYNYISGCTKPAGNYPKDDPLVLCTMADFVPIIYTKQKDDIVITEVEQYNDLKLAGIKIPGTLTANGIDLPFKYSYTLTPCMNYGKLKHLAVSNTVDFSNLHAFEQSNFNDWRYHIDGNQLRLTFGAEVFDTYETYKADGLVLEFYDLWGFAGSLEISNKKSYSGSFTKLLSLNTLGSLSKNRIINGSYSDSFVRNVNISVKEENDEVTFYYNNNQIQYSDDTTGWVGIDALDNDCGVLYSNLIYGVKAYIKRTTESGTEFIHKRNMVLFTMPIYNDFYYTVSDFNTLVDPKIELMLTHKLVDSGNVEVYKEPDKFINGYSLDDYELLRAYTAGTLSASELLINKYYTYRGDTSLYLEIGLHEKYSNIGLKYDPVINNYFKYNLVALSNHNKDATYSILSDKYPNESETNLLSYGSFVPSELNKFELISDTNNETLFNRGYLNNPGDNPRHIEYQFTIGYPIEVKNISLKTISTNVICALLHMDGGSANYSDFNLKLSNEGNIYPTMFYSGGNHQVLEMGLIDLVNPNATTMWEQLENKNCVYTSNVESGRQDTVRKLYEGDPIKSLYNTLGKYTFFQPHAHAAPTMCDSATNIHLIDPSLDILFIHASNESSGGWPFREKTSGTDGDYDTSYGRTPSRGLLNHPRYNMAVYSIDQYNNSYGVLSTNAYELMDVGLFGSECGDKETNEFPYGWSPNRYTACNIFHGLTANELVDCYNKFATTMSQVYAYNPDYPYVTSFSGDSSILDKEVYVTSNIVNNHSELLFNPETQKFNDYIFIGDVSVTKYLSYLDTYSGNSKFSENSCVQFLPDFTYCGTEENPLLISSLTYKLIPDESVLTEIEPNIGGSYAVRHFDGSINWVNGNIRQDRLYGYSTTYNKLIPLQVGNYEINPDDGSINVDSIHLDNTTARMSRIPNYSDFASKGFVELDGIRFELDTENLIFLTSDKDSVYLVAAPGAPSKLTLTISDAYNPGVLGEFKIFSPYTSLVLLTDACGLTDNSSINLKKCSAYVLNNIITKDYSDMVSIPGYTNQVPISVIRTSSSTSSKAYPNVPAYTLGSSSYTRLIKMTFNSILYLPSATKSVASVVGDVMDTRTSYNYCTTNGAEYTVKSQYNYALIPHTSITLEDLHYEPNNSTHRLFFKSNKFWYASDMTGRVFYRELPNRSELDFYSGFVDLADTLGIADSEADRLTYSWGSAKGQRFKDGGANEWQHNNMLYIHSGPCFMPKS